MIDTVLSLLGLGQAQRHRSADRFAVTSTHLSNIERLALEVNMRMAYETDRLLGLAEEFGVPHDLVYEPLRNMLGQITQIHWTSYHVNSNPSVAWVALALVPELFVSVCETEP